MRTEPLEHSPPSGLLFLCSGNMIRSAFAELYARHVGIPLAVRSAGTTYRNPRLHEETRQALLVRGVPAKQVDEFRPRLLAELEPPPGTDEIVLGMTHEHLDAARSAGVPGPVLLLTEASGGHGEIPDPYFEGNFDGAFERLALCVQALADRLARL